MLARPCVATTIVLLMLSLAGGHGRAAAPEHAGKRLIISTFEGKDGCKASVAMRTNDLSLAGFANGSRHWYAFPGNEDLLPTATPLPFGSSYRDLIGGLHNLPGVALGKEPSLQAVGVLSAAQDPATTGGDHVPLKRALAALKVTTTESMRLKPIQEAVVKGWKTEARVAAEHLPYIQHWDTMSFEIIRANRNGGVWSGPFTELLRKSANIHSKEEALAVVDALVNRSFEDVVMAHAREA